MIVSARTRLAACAGIHPKLKEGGIHVLPRPRTQSHMWSTMNILGGPLLLSSVYLYMTWSSSLCEVVSTPA